MVDVLLFHHAQGLTEGVVAFADRLRASGHRVTVPDLYGGATFRSVENGVAHAEHLGFENIIAAGVAVAETLPDRIVYGVFAGSPPYAEAGADPPRRVGGSHPPWRCSFLDIWGLVAHGG